LKQLIYNRLSYKPNKIDKACKAPLQMSGVEFSVCFFYYH